VGNFGMSLAVTLMAVSWTCVGFGMMFLASSMGGFGVVPVIAIWVLGYVFLALFASALNGIYTAALYRYAITGDAGNFDADILGNAFRPKK
jgi:hypothetical protein